MSVSVAEIKSKLMKFVTNRQTIGFLISVVVMAVISIAFFYPDNFEGNDLRQHDVVQGIANGQEVKEYREQTGEQSWWTNSLFGGMPTFQISPVYPSNALFTWVKGIYGLGLPSPSNLLFMMMVGFMIMMMAMRIRWEYGLIGAIAWGLSTYYIILIGAGHIWKFETLAYIPPTIGGIILAYRGRYLAGGAMAAFFAMMQLNANHPQMTYYFGFVILALIIGYLIKDYKSKKMRSWGIATGSLVIAAALALCANLPSLYHTSKYAKETQRQQSELQVDGNASAEQTDSAMRAWITQYSYKPSETFTLFIPDVKGGASVMPKDGGLQFASLAGMDKANEYNSDQFVDIYLNYSSQYFGDPMSTNGPVYVGVIIFALFLAGCIIVRGPVKWGMLAVLVITVILSWGHYLPTLTDLFIDIVPMYSSFRTVESILVVAEFIIPLLAIVGLYKLYNPDNRLTPPASAVATSPKRPKFLKEKGDKALVFGFGIVGFFCLIGAVAPGFFGKGYDEKAEEYTSNRIAYDLYLQGYDPEMIAQIQPMLSIENPDVKDAVESLRMSLVRNDAIRSIFFLLLGAGAVGVWRFNLLGRQRLSTMTSVGAIGVLVLIDLYSVNKRYLNHESFFIPELTVNETIVPTAIDKEILADTDPNYRVADFDRFGDAQPSYFHKMIGGYHAAKLGRYNDLINNDLIKPNHINILNMLNARYIVQGGQVYVNDMALGNAWFVDDVSYVNNANEEMEALEFLSPEFEAVADKSMEKILGKASAGSPDDSIVETSYAPNRLTYRSRTSSPRVAVFSEIYFPWGWEATVDGKPAEIARVNYVLRAIVVPEGEHEIVMTFDPKSIHTTTTIATIAIILIYIAVIAAVCCALIGCGKCEKGKE